MKRLSYIMALVFGANLVGCKTVTKSDAELLFPLGVHTWKKGADYRTEPPSDDCVGCPTIELTAPASLAGSGYEITLSGNDTTLDVRGLMTEHGITEECGTNNDIYCSNEYRIWPPDSGDDTVGAQTPGGAIPDSGVIDFTGSFYCGTSRVVIVAENTNGLTRYIFEVTRGGSLCEVAATGRTLNVRLVWDTVGTDLDLHFVRESSPGVDGMMNTGDDCYYSNCAPSTSYGTSSLDWGSAGDASDNPLLDIDDTDGEGPENILIVNPQVGRYQIAVEYFSGTPATLPMIEVYYDGKFVDLIVFAPDSFLDNDVWYAGDVNVPQSGSATVDEYNILQ